MPFLFERIDDETELLLPDNLLHSDSLIRKLVNAIDEKDWQEVEIIGWPYQFYISEKKDQVIGKVVKSEDIPAATQLFTPNWIVKYLVQNSLGRQWMTTYPNSPLREDMEYYIEPAEQTPEVQAQLKEITPDSLNPEELTLLDPACGSGHILAEAYDPFKAIYQERGYQARHIPSLILQKNLFGLEIDDRATQLAAFALMMKARADDRRIFASGVKPHVLAIQDSKGLDAQQITEALNVPILKTALLPSDYLLEELEEERAPLFSRKNLSVKGDIAQADVARLIELFEHGKTFGSLIRVPEVLAEKLPVIAERVKDILSNGELLGKAAAKALIPFIEQARILAGTYDAVVANPPYIGGHGQNPTLKKFLTEQFPDVKSDTFSAFILRNREWASKEGNIGIMCPFVWMFLSSYQRLRASIIDDATLTTLIQLEYSGFDGATVPICTFTMNNTHIPGFVGSFIKLSDFKGAQNQGPKALEAIRNKNCDWFYLARQDDFQKLPGSPLAYWASAHVRLLFSSNPPLANVARSAKGLDTCDND
jgi:type II restriction/modification system DNA methylase subunit YeeA